MKAIVLPAPHSTLEVRRDYPDPEGPVVIKVTACGVCHSDLHVVDGEYPASTPLVLGHEITGTHPQLGPVMVYAPWGCGRCTECHDGLEMLCTGAAEAGLVVDGGYAELLAVPDTRYLAPLDDLDPVASAPLACGGLTAYRAVQHTVDHLRSRRHPRAMVIGAGGLGQFAIRFLRLLTDAHVTSVDTNPDKTSVALEAGAHQAIEVGAPDRHKPETARQFDAVLDFVGSDPTLALATESVGKRAMVVAVGLGGGRVPFGFGAVPHETRFLTSVWGSRAQLDELLQLARREPSIIQPVQTLLVDQAQLAHDRLRAGEVKGRIVLTMH